MCYNFRAMRAISQANARIHGCQSRKMEWLSSRRRPTHSSEFWKSDVGRMCWICKRSSSLARRYDSWWSSANKAHGSSWVGWCPTICVSGCFTQRCLSSLQIEGIFCNFLLKNFMLSLDAPFRNLVSTKVTGLQKLPRKWLRHGKGISQNLFTGMLKTKIRMYIEMLCFKLILFLKGNERRTIHPLASTSIADMLQEFCQFNYLIIFVGYGLMVLLLIWAVLKYFL